MVAKIETIREITGGPIDFKFSPDTWDKIGKVILADQSERIVYGQKTDGTQIKTNAPSTIRRKQRLRRKGLLRGKITSLVETGRRLVRPGMWKVRTLTNGVEVKPGEMLVMAPGQKKPRSPAQLAQWVQMKGYVGWIGAGKRAIAAIRAIFKGEIQKAQAKAAAKRRTIRA